MSNFAQYRCLIHGNWVNSSNYEKCPICGEKCDHINETDPDNALNVEQSSVKKARLLAEQAAERDREAAAAKAAEAALERTIRRATAALNYDLDRWMAYDPVTGDISEERL